MAGKKIKVLRIINRFNLGGPTFNVAYLTKYLGDEFETLLVGGDKELSEESSAFIVEQLGIEPVIIPEMQRSLNLKQDIAAYRKLKKIIQEFQPDIVHTHAAKSGALGRLAAYSANVPVILHTFHGHVFHSYFGKLKTTFYKTIERFLAKKSTRIIAISDIQKNELVEEHRICDKDKMIVVPLGFDLQRFRDNKEEKRNSFRAHYQLKDDEIAIGIVGRLVPIKNHPLFLDALNHVVKKTNKKVRAFVIGDGDEKDQLFDHLNRIGLTYTEWSKEQKNVPVTFTSWIKNVDWANAGLDIIALSSRNEGTPVSLIEAQASGNPIVTTAVGGIENIVKNEETAIVVASDDLTAFSEGLFRLVEDEELRRKMGENGWEYVNQKFHFKRLTKDMREIYLQLLNKN